MMMRLVTKALALAMIVGVALGDGDAEANVPVEKTGTFCRGFCLMGLGVLTMFLGGAERDFFSDFCLLFFSYRN
jgi:hypothetical protein